MRVLLFTGKGGVGKTSTAANLAAVLGTRGRTLVVDADPQDSLGRAFGVVAKGREDSLAGLLEDPSWNAAAFAAGVGLGVVVLAAGVLLGGRVFDRRGPEMLAAALRA